MGKIVGEGIAGFILRSLVSRVIKFLLKKSVRKVRQGVCDCYCSLQTERVRNFMQT